ncbi:glycoprotease family-domain-containing protein [Parachaetomium inaequale]|uniref:N(6)-L-threonylcarbamoyladenine synthase n=1 Tax=Parachaetomium inaequale TaxID=2588326 RepID=A0AAN6SWD5_9PEZI|nr:glycoprotease family-domain-containing protein [Parachaetomium inaequale]
MSDPRALQPGSDSRLSARTKDDWEDWEDDEVLTPITTRDGPLLDAGPERQASQRTATLVARQSAQNAMAGIKVQQQQHIAHQMRSFVDAAALKALEGAPSEDSIGTFAWLRRKPTKGKRIERLVAEAEPQADLSPSARPIMIGFAMPSNSDVVISPQTAVPTQVTSPNQPVSAWVVQRGCVPAVPSIPSHYRAADLSPVTAITTPIYVSDDDDDMATPVTLKSHRVRGRQRSATGGSSRSQGCQSPGSSQPKADEGQSCGPRSTLRMHHRPPEIIIEDAAPPAMAEEAQTPGELPPPYSPPKTHNARYRAVFPPGHPLNTLYPPSPGPGAISLSDHQQPLPDRPLGSFVAGDHFLDRRRRRHEKEDVVAWKAGRMPGREGRKRRRVCLGVCIAILLLTALGVTLGILLSRRTVAEESMPSRFLNLTNFPPMPTGISTVIGPDSDSTTACEQADSVAPFDASQPSFLWNVAGDAPRPTPTDPGNAIPLPPRAIPVTGFTSLVRRFLRARDESGSSLALRSDPPPPTFQEMFFLGNTTDGVVSDDKAGEPTPFYISMLRSVNDTVGPTGLLNASDIAPPPALDKDGTGAPAVLLAFPTQQPRYGFYSYFNKTTYVKSVDVLLGDGAGGDSSPVPADQNGGSLKTEAKFLVTWLSVRYKVEIWTRMANTTRLTGKAFGGGPAALAANGTQPGSFPYPVTVTLDTHGGARGKKFAFVRGVDDRQRIKLDDARFVLNRMNTTGDLVNPAGEFNPSFGGMDGGTGGCKCEPLPPKKFPGSLLTLAIETSCDDTCVAILEKHGDRAIVHFNAKITANNLRFGGVEPISAVESHSAHIAALVHRALRSMPATNAVKGVAEIDPFTKKIFCYRARPSFISVTRGPGMTPALSVGLTMAKGLAVAWKVPMVAVHHMQAHALTPRLVDALAREPVEDYEQAMIMAELATPKPQFPFLSLLVSGGHTQLLLSESITSHTVLAEAQNVAIGDMLDKCARAILPASVIAGAENVMYAAQLEAFAFAPAEREWLHEPTDPYATEYGYLYNPPVTRGDEMKPYVSPTYGWTLTPPLAERRDMVYDFSGLGGQVRAIMEKKPDMDFLERRELARETMRVAFEHLASRLVLALDAMKEKRWQATRRKETRDDAAAAEEKQDKADATRIPPSMNNVRVKTLVVAGGVASNKFLHYILRRVLEARGYYGPSALDIVRPPADMCTDNAAMVAWAGMEMFEAGWFSDLGVLPERKWSMDNGGSAGAGGILELGGWRPRPPPPPEKQKWKATWTGPDTQKLVNRIRKSVNNPRKLVINTRKSWKEIWKVVPKRVRKDPNYKGWIAKMVARRGATRRRNGEP